MSALPGPWLRRALLGWALLLALTAPAAPLISEFMAENKSVLADQDGEFSDWVEVHNPGPGTLDLGGYCLTDERDIPAKWRFPAGVVLAEGGFKIVFASGKDRAIATNELHTNFQLDKNGGYLALVAPDGLTVLQAFNPYPQQSENVSFGPGRAVEPLALVASNTLARVLVPADGALSLSWSGGHEPFDDATWLAGLQGAGYDTGTGSISPLSNQLPSTGFAHRYEMDLAPNDLDLGDNSSTGNNGAWRLDFLRLQPGAFAPDVEPDLFGSRIRTDLRSAMFGVNASAYVRLLFAVSGSPNEFSNLVLRVNYDDGFVAYLNGIEVAQRNAPASRVWNSASETNRTDSLALTAETLDLTAFIPLLVSGPNVLAFHALNSDASAGRFLLAAELDGVRLHQTDVFFAQPTPGGTNADGALPPLPKVEFSLNSRFFTETLTLTLSNTFPDAAIYFTTNGSIPVPVTATLCTGPIPITDSRQIRAQAFLAGWSPSPVKSESYLKVGADLGSFASPLPVMVLHNFGAGAVPGVNGQGPNGDGSQVVQVLLQPHALTILDRDTNGVTTFTNAIATGTRAGVRLHGSSAFRNTKKSYTLETWGETDQADRDRSLLGMPAESDWVLYGPSWKFPGGSADFDAALIHNSFIYALANASGYYAPRTRFVEVFLNTSGGPVTRSNYAGLYLLTEKVKRANGRVQFPEMSPQGASGGWMINSDRMDALPPGSAVGSMNPRHFHTAGPDRILQTTNDNARGFKGIKYNLNGTTTTETSGLNPARDDMPNSYHSMFNFESPDGWTVTTAQRSEIETFLRSFDSALYGQDYTNPATGYAAFIDVDNWVHHFILQNFPKNQDAELLSTYFVRESPTAKLKHGPIWDFDRAYNKNPTSGVATSDLEWVRSRLFYLRLFSDREFMQAYIDKWQALRRGALSDSNLLAIVDRQVNEVTCGGTNNAVLIREGMTNWPERIATFKAWLINRSAALDAQFQKMPAFCQDGGAVPNGFTVTLTNLNAGGTIFFTLDGFDPRARGGNLAATAQVWPQDIVLNATTVVRARVRNGTNWSGLAEAVFYTPQDFSGLALSEIMYNPPDIGATAGDDFEFLELRNTGSNTLNLSGLSFTAGITFTFTNGTLLAPGAFFVLVRNTNGFATQYPGLRANGVYSGKLDNAGETLTLSTAPGTRVFSVTYDNAAPWPLAPDGFGFSLVQRNPGLSQAPENGAKWRASTNPGGSPGADDPAPAIPPVVINELLTHTDLPLVDAIELHNPTAAPADISGWFLSDDPHRPRKFRIPEGTEITAGGFVVFRETDFNPTPGASLSFMLSSLGETVYLTSADANGNLTGYSHGVTFGAAADGVSFGRHLNSAGEEDWPAQLGRTLGDANSGPRVGPVVLSEIFYHPPVGGVEFVEVANLSGEPVPLFDPLFPTNTWRLGGADFAFPTNVTLPPGGLALVVATNEAAFRALYEVPTNALVFGPMGGALQDSGERLALERPDTPLTNGIVPCIVVDEVRYNDKAPWPPAADGGGPSLQRLDLAVYANEPLNWTASAPTPGSLPFTNPDRDGDDMPNDWELAHGLNPDDSGDAALDSDGDGLTNLQEFLAGTDPQSAASALRLDLVRDCTGPRLTFIAVAGRSYAVQASATLTAGGWTTVFTLTASPFTQSTEWTDTNAVSQRFYRVVMPRAAE